jgi:hypothetical protein
VHDSDPFEFLELREMTIAGHNQVRAASDSALENSVVVRIRFDDALCHSSNGTPRVPLKAEK